jgi:multiple sugar transport system permease protein
MMREEGRAVAFKVSRSRSGRIALKALIYAILIAIALVMVMPVYWALSTSFKPMDRAYDYPPKFIPRPFTLKNYQAVLGQYPFGLYTLNSFKIATLVTIGRLFVCSLAAYAFARLRFWGRDAVFLMLIATMMVPFAVILIPSYVLFKYLHWVDTHWPLIVPPIMESAYGTFLLRQFFMTIPSELDDAAKIDGCSSFRIYYTIMLPLSKPALATLAVFTFMFSWNDFLGPLIYLSNIKLMTAQLGLAMYNLRYGARWPELMAGTVVVMLPILVVYIFSQRYFVQGIAMTGLKT